ncbi:hypothetical protein [Mesorhizobium sp. 1B3]|uniref:hypothetical protein n=1 Tax=Mesorhizobium sp. 1B3 TaxID=3243599 RepID=UPI003D98EE38
MPDFVLTAKDGTRHRITAPDEAAARKALAAQEGEPREEAGGHLAAVGTGLRRLVEGIPSLPGTAREVQFAAAEAIARWLNAPGAQAAIDGINKARQFRSVPTAEEVTAATTKVIGAPYKPKTTAEEYTATAAEFLPGLLVGGGPVRKGIQWLLPALLSETGGQIARRTIPQYEPHVRFGLGLGAEFLPGGILRMTTGPHALRAPVRAETLQPQSAPDAVGQITESEGTRYAVGGPIEGNPGAIAEQQGTFPQTGPERSDIDADVVSPIVMREASIVEDAGTNAERQVKVEPMTSRVVDGVGSLPAPPQQSFPSVPPNSKLARILRDGVQPTVPHSPIPRDHPVRGKLPPVSDPVENKPRAIIDQQGNAPTHTVPDRTATDADMVSREGHVVANVPNNAPEKVRVITTPSQKRDRLMSVPAQPKPGTASETPYSELAGLFREGVHPQVAQTPIPRYDPPRGVPSRIADLTANRYVRDKIIENIERGIRMGGPDWLNAEPLRLAFIDELKDLEGGQRFDHFFDLFGATTALSRARENLRNTSFYYTLSDRRLPDVNPYPYGHRAQALHRRNVERVWSGGLDPLRFPKSVSISANAKGNYLPVTVDSNIFRQAAMLSGDTRFLTTFLPIKSGGSRNIRREYNAGLISPEELSQPSYWSPAPRRNEYPAMEQYFQGIARELGMTPAQAEASAWLGGAELTGLRSDPSKKLMDFYKDSLLLTAIKEKMDPRDVFKRTIRGQLPLITLGGVTLAPYLMPREKQESHAGGQQF